MTSVIYWGNITSVIYIPQIYWGKSSTSSGLELQSVSHTSIYENSELSDLKNINFFGEISNNWWNHLLGTNVYKHLESCWRLDNITLC